VSAITLTADEVRLLRRGLTAGPDGIYHDDLVSSSRLRATGYMRLVDCPGHYRLAITDTGRAVVHNWSRAR